MRGRRRALRRPDHEASAEPLAWQRAHAGDLRRRPGGRQGISQPPVSDHRGRRRTAGNPDRCASGRHHRHRLRHRWRAFGSGGLHRHEPLGPRQRPRRRGGSRRRAAGLGRSLQGRLGDRPAGCRPGPARRRRLLRDPDPRRPHRQGSGRCPHRPRLRRFADLGLRPSRRRHLHQGGRCRRGPRRQGGGRDPGGRPA